MIDVWGGAWGAAWGNAWGIGGASPEEDAPHHGDGDDGKRRTLHIFKPTGLLERHFKSGRKTVDERVRDSIKIHAEITGKIAKEFSQESERIAAQPPVVEMSLVDVDREIGVLLRKKMRTEDDELLLLILIAACA